MHERICVIPSDPLFASLSDEGSRESGIADVSCGISRLVDGTHTSAIPERAVLPHFMAVSEAVRVILKRA